MITVAALYVDARGPYPRMQDVDCWDETRDARGYSGPHPVVAHPPCGPWGAMARLSLFQDGELAPAAVAQVRRWGGVLEHPARSRLWLHCGLPMPGELPDAFGGFSLEVNQCDWGHVAQKTTWLYLVGVRLERYPRMPRREPTHWICGSRQPRSGGGVAPAHVKFCSAQLRRRTPPAFAEFLVSLARRARPHGVAA